MNREGIESLRQCLLADEAVRKMIAMRAYQLFENRGQVHGFDQEDWHQAENEILSKLIAGELAVADTPVRVSITQKPTPPAPLTARRTRTRRTQAKKEVKAATKATAEKTTSLKTKAAAVIAITKKPTEKIPAAETSSMAKKKSTATTKSRKAKTDASQTTLL
jgi:hypothetical protein